MKFVTALNGTAQQKCMYKNSAVEQDALDCWAVEGYQQLLMDVLLERSQKEQALLGLFDSPGVYGPDEVS